jgi:hypothetical protein
LHGHARLHGGVANQRRLFRYHAPIMNFVSGRVFATGVDGALMPYDCFVDPVVMTCWIPVRVLTTGGRFGDALVAPIHQATSPPRSNHASVTALSMMCR